MRKTINYFLFLLAALPVSAQTINEKIRAVENNLGGAVRIQDSSSWNLIDRMKYYRVNGLSVAVINDYKIEWTKGYGWADTAEHRKVTPRTLFQPASVGKSTHALGTMKLVEKGLIDPEKDINEYLVRWKFPYDSLSKGKKITLLHLLSNSAGVSVHGFDGYKWNQPLPNILQILNGEPPSNSPAVRSAFEPGLKFQYSGGGYTISGMMVEDVTGSKYADYMRQNVLKPLGMNDTYFYGELTANTKKRLATAYRIDGKPIGCKYHIYPEDACGASLWSTPADIARFIIDMQRSLINKSNKVVSAATAKKMVTPFVSDFYGLGFFIEKKGEQTYFHHTGLNEGFVSDYYGSIEGGKGVVVMANADIALPSDITEEIINSVATVYGWKGFYNPVVKKTIPLPDTLRKRYTGNYKFVTNDLTVKIFEKDKKLWFHFGGSPLPWEIHFITQNDFFFLDMPTEQKFIINPEGRITGFEIATPDGPVSVKKIG